MPWGASSAVPPKPQTSRQAASRMAPRRPRVLSTFTPMRPPTQNAIMQNVKVILTADISQP